MRTTFALCILAAIGCAPPARTYDSECPWTPSQFNLVVETFADAWFNRFDQALDFRELDVDCQPGRTVLWDSSDGTVKRAHGVTLHRTEILIPVANKPLLVDTTFAHELVHVALWQLHDDPDDESHAAGDGTWLPDHDTFVADINSDSTLRAATARASP